MGDIRTKVSRLENDHPEWPQARLNRLGEMIGYADACDTRTDDTHVCVSGQQSRAALTRERISIRGGICPEGTCRVWAWQTCWLGVVD